MKTLAVDFETTYNDEVSIKPLGHDAYFRHPEFEAYLVAVKGTDGFEWLGHPAECPWNKLIEEYPVWVAHNASFDENLYLTARELGWWDDLDGPIGVPQQWHCSSDMAAYLGYPRSLKDACGALLNVELSKEVRTNMKGLRPPDSWHCCNKNSLSAFEPMKEDFWQEVLDYAFSDMICLDLWSQYSDQWPEHERWLSRHTRDMGRRGVAVDIKMVRDAASGLRKVLFAYESAIPWSDDQKLMSRTAFNEECAKHNLRPPDSLAKDSAEAELWFETYEKKYEWIHAYRNWRRANALLSRVDAVLRGSRDVGDHWRYFGSLMYCAAHTRRWGGGGGNLNMQNPPKGEVTFACADESVTVAFRDFFIASPGTKLVALDLSQIEVRTLSWLSGDTEMLDQIRNSPDIYQAFAEKFDLWSPELGVLKDVDPSKRQYTKPIVLGSGFGASSWAFADKYYRELRDNLERLGEQDWEAEGREFLSARLADTYYGTWWWRKASALLEREATVEVVVREAKDGNSGITKTVPQWKAWAEETLEMGKQMERYATLPIDLDRWTWDWEKVAVYRAAEECVQLYRSSMVKVTEFWDKLKNVLSSSLLDRHMVFNLPSGNRLHYRRIRSVKGKDDEGKDQTTVFADVPGSGRSAWRTMRPWHGLLTENLAQALARDVFGVCIRRVEEDTPVIPLWTCHDEIVGEVPEGEAEAGLESAVNVMSSPPEWIPTLPVSADGSIGGTYRECK